MNELTFTIYVMCDPIIYDDYRSKRTYYLYNLTNIIYYDKC